MVQKWMSLSCKRQVTSGSPDMPLTLRRTKTGSLGVTFLPSFNLLLSLGCKLASMLRLSCPFLFKSVDTYFSLASLDTPVMQEGQVRHAQGLGLPASSMFPPVTPLSGSFTPVLDVSHWVFLPQASQPEGKGSHPSTLCLPLNHMPCNL